MITYQKDTFYFDQILFPKRAHFVLITFLKAHFVLNTFQKEQIPKRANSILNTFQKEQIPF